MLAILLTFVCFGLIVAGAFGQFGVDGAAIAAGVCGLLVLEARERAG